MPGVTASTAQGKSKEAPALAHSDAHSYTDDKGCQTTYHLLIRSVHSHSHTSGTSIQGNLDFSILLTKQPVEAQSH